MLKILIISLLICFVLTKSQLAGGISYLSKDKCKSQQICNDAWKYAKSHYKNECHLNKDIKWKSTKSIGSQVVAGMRYWFTAKLSDNKTYKMSVWHQLNGKNKFVSCSKNQ